MQGNGGHENKAFLGLRVSLLRLVCSFLIWVWYPPIALGIFSISHNCSDVSFVRFSTSEEAAEAIRGMSGMRVQHKTLLCKLSNTSNAGNARVCFPLLHPTFSPYSLLTICMSSLSLSLPLKKIFAPCLVNTEK